MKSLYKIKLDEIATISSVIEKCNALFPFIRSLTQVIALVSLDISISKLEEDERLIDFIYRIQKPSDGLPYEILDYLVPKFRTDIDKRFMDGWFEKKDNISLADELLNFIEFRNSSAGHGVLDLKKSEEWAPKLISLSSKILEVCDSLIPSVNNKLKVLDGHNVSIPLLYQEEPFVITSIKQRKGLWRLKGQTLNIFDSKEFSFGLNNSRIFNIERINTKRGYDLVEINNESNDILFHNIPVRQTDSFHGRGKELETLTEWYSDIDSRVCLIYGDGGYGKTTFILESLNQFLDGSFELENNNPLYICYYSAKKTKWTEDGLIYFQSSQPMVDDCIREIVKTQVDLAKEWYSTEGRALVDKAKNLLQKNKINRDDILLIIDNSETLANSPIEVKELSERVKYISKNIARVIITSRRRELIQAEPILIEGLNESESIELMKNLSVRYSADSLNKAGESRLRKVVNKLMYKPLLIEAYVKYMKHSQSSIDEGLNKFYKSSNEELLEFLYEDAWLRMNELQRKVFLVVIHVDCEINNRILDKIYQLVEINKEEFTQAYEETYFANIIDFGSEFIFEIVNLAQIFFKKQFSSYSKDVQDDVKNKAQEAELYGEKLKEMEKSYKTDRVSEAFRSEYARFAKSHTDRGEIDKAIEMYELALIDDPINSYLYDRFAWLLINKTNNFEKALELSQKAFDLDKNNVDAMVNLALSYYKLKNIKKGDEFIELCVKKGRSEAFVLLRKGIARYQIAKNLSDNKYAISLYNEAIKYFGNTQDSVKSGVITGYEAKIRDDAVRYNNLSLKRLNDMKFQN